MKPEKYNLIELLRKDPRMAVLRQKGAICVLTALALESIFQANDPYIAYLETENALLKESLK